MTATTTAWLVVAVLASATGTQEAPPRDSLALALVERAREARGREAEGLSAYEAIVRERAYIGLTASRLRRERGLLRTERVARVRWEAGDPETETVRWLGIRHDVPIAGDVADMRTDRPQPLETYPLDPTGDRLQLGDGSFLHPLADTAAAHYRYASGDTMRIELPAVDREIVMAEVRFRPRRNAFRLLAGSLWFDLESAALIRGVFRPSRAFNLELDAPEDAEEVPGFLKPIIVEVDAMAVEYGLYDLRWWLAHRVRFEGTARLGGLAALPITVETVAEEVDVDGRTLSSSAGRPSGLRRIVERDGTSNDSATAAAADGRVREPPPNRRVVYVPTDEKLRDSPYLTGERFSDGSVAFSASELDWLHRRLDDFETPPAVPPAAVRVTGWRYNRVEALSAALRGRIPLGERWELTGSLRLGLGDRVPNVEGGVRRTVGPGELSARGYHVLRPVGDWGDPFALDASTAALLLGYDDGHYARVTGAEIAYAASDGRLRFGGRLFAERHRPERKHTDVSLANLLGDAEPPENLAAERLDLFGAAGRWRMQVGLDPDGWIGTGALWGEIGLGDREYGRLAGSLSGSRPIAGRLSGGVEVQAGTTWGRVPAQRRWLLGGPATLRAFPGGSISGGAFWLGRFELGYGLPAVRLTGFADLGWAGSRSDFASRRPSASAGLGVSALDGLVRVDVARVVRGRMPRRIRVHLYVDGIL